MSALQRWSCAVLSVLFLCSGVRAEDDDPVDEYEQQLNLVNSELDLARTASDCPISVVINTCGDGRCNRDHEDETNCSADCVVAHVKSFNRQISCPEVQELFYPSSIAEVQSIIRGAHAREERVRVVGSRHSINQQYCTDGIVVSMEDFNGVLGIERASDGSEVVVVEAGITTGDLAEWLHGQKRSLGYAHLGFRLASIGGAIATGAHGSSHKHTSVISSLVRGVTLINSRGEVVEIDDGHDLMKAVRAHLGLLGVIVKVKLAIRQQFKLHMRVSDHDEREILRDQGLRDAIADCDFSLINWFPNRGRFIKSCAKETRRLVDRNAENVLVNPEIPPGLIMPYKVALHYGMCYPAVAAMLEDLRFYLFKWQPPFVKAGFWGGLFGGVIHSNNVVGYSHRIMSSELNAALDGFFQHDQEIAVPLSRIDGALRALRDYIHAHDLHFPLFGIFLRFAPSEDKTLLAHTTSVGDFHAGEPIVLVEIVTPEVIGFPPEMKAAIEGAFESMARTLITDFSGRPHWGKNKDWAFDLQRQRNIYGEKLTSFQAAMATLDPDGMFANNFARRAGISPSTHAAGRSRCYEILRGRSLVSTGNASAISEANRPLQTVRDN